jgi:valyl-tRNA synthetase
VEIVKARARSESDAAGRASAVASLKQGLSVLLRLFAPYLPYITEEVWGWAFAEKHASVHRAPWPGAAEFAGLPAGEGPVFDTAIAFLEAVHKAKSAAGATVGRHVSRLRVAAHPATATRLQPSLTDVLSAARVLDHTLEAREGLEEGTFEVLEMQLAEGAPATA